MVMLLSESDVSDGLKEVEVENVYALIEGVGEDLDQTLQFKITNEGLTIDLFDEDGEVIGTNAFDLDLLINDYIMQ